MLFKVGDLVVPVNETARNRIRRGFPHWNGNPVTISKAWYDEGSDPYCRISWSGKEYACTHYQSRFKLFKEEDKNAELIIKIDILWKRQPYYKEYCKDA